MITFSQKGDFRKTDDFLRRTFAGQARRILETNGQAGVAALAAATPVDSGNSADGWGYEVSISGRGGSIRWTNSNVTSSGVPVVILLQYGHGTGTGGYVEGRDFINPALKPVFDRIAETVWKAVTK